MCSWEVAEWEASDQALIWQADFAGFAAARLHLVLHAKAMAVKMVGAGPCFVAVTRLERDGMESAAKLAMGG